MAAEVRVMDYDGTRYTSAIPKGITFNQVWKAMNIILSNRHKVDNRCVFIQKDK